jgi:hypothetical protein
MREVSGLRCVKSNLIGHKKEICITTEIMVNTAWFGNESFGNNNNKVWF